MIRETFATDYKLKVKVLPEPEMANYTEDNFFMHFSKQTILGKLAESTTKELFKMIKHNNIVNGIFDVTLDFGDIPGTDVIIDDSLVIAYTYTAYEELFNTVIEPTYGKGNVFAIIHGGKNDAGEEIVPFMQLAFIAGTIKEGQDKTSLEDWLRPLQQGIVDFMHIIYPAYVTASDTSVKLSTWDHELNVMPLIEDNITVQ